MKDALPKKGPDYTLNLFPAQDPDSKAEGVRIVVQTTKVFVSFQYDVLLECSVRDRSIRVRIKGLHAPEMLMPGGGPASGTVHLAGLLGHYTLIVSKQDKAESSYDIDVAKDAVTILRSPDTTFVQVSNEPVPA